MIENVPKTFRKNINITDSCWLWTAYKNKDGYGFITYRRKRVLVHRFSYELFKGDIPKGMCVLHSCDNPSCIKPEHLSIGTHQENMKDRDLKRRLSYGETHGSAKLTQSQVEEIRSLYKRGNKGEFSLKGLAKKFGVSGSQISLIVNYKNWRNTA